MTAAPAVRGGRSLAPKEHGAYGQLALPLLVALSAAPHLGAWLMAAGAVAAFLAHEPVLVLLGQRGERARTADGGRARTRLLVLAVAALVLGGGGLVLAPPAARLAALLPLALACIVAFFVARGAERTAPGELLAATSLAAIAVPVSVASGVAVHVALYEWVAWTLALASGIAAVRAVIAAHKHRPERGALPTVLVAGLAALAGSLHEPRLAAALPMVIVAAVVLVLTPHPRALRTVGWSLVAATVLVGAGLVVLRVRG